MATVTLGTVGFVVGGLVGMPMVGAMVGASLGSYIDNQALYPALFPPDYSVGPKLGDLDYQSAEEGSPANYCLGPYCKTSGTVIWMSDLYY